VARFSLDEYETVEERLRRFWAKWPDGAIQTDMLNTDADRERKQWIVQAWVYRHRDDVRAIGTGLAFEVDGGMGANQTAALENAETSAIGRALANCGFSGNKRASREEMAKANRSNVTPIDSNWQAIVQPPIDPAKATTTDELNTMWAEAVATGQSKTLQAAFTKRKKELADA
jgi:hypothetical protein